MACNVESMDRFLASTQIIDWEMPLVRAKASQLADGCTSDLDIAKRCCEFVRDQVRHSWDYKLNPVTSKASDVLMHMTGYCYAKSHLLAALLRANKIPAGLCYQRLTVERDGQPYCLHGLNAVYLKQYGWYRADARGNKPGIRAEFTPPIEQLAFTIMNPGEADLPEILPEPLLIVIKTLQEHKTVEEVYQNLPDICLSESGNP